MCRRICLVNFKVYNTYILRFKVNNFYPSMVLQKVMAEMSENGSSKEAIKKFVKKQVKMFEKIFSCKTWIDRINFVSIVEWLMVLTKFFASFLILKLKTQKAFCWRLKQHLLDSLDVFFTSCFVKMFQATSEQAHRVVTDFIVRFYLDVLAKVVETMGWTPDDLMVFYAMPKRLKEIIFKNDPWDFFKFSTNLIK